MDYPRTQPWESPLRPSKQHCYT
ncbi:hypothetical protein RJ641_015818 [Dillenia turbinata]|uniref:Uncharacterized protein n=1 Tax=Dillenia turbinata TaxID=194707 RepID=A0AAN8USN8_9MAGN